MRITWRQMYPEYKERLEMMALHIALINNWSHLKIV